MRLLTELIAKWKSYFIRYLLISEVVRFQSWRTNKSCCKLQCFSLVVSRESFCRKKNWKNIWNKLGHLDLRKGRITFTACCHLGVLGCISFNNMCPNMSIKECLYLVTQLWVGLLHVHIYLRGERGGSHYRSFFPPPPGWGWGGGGEMLLAPIRTVRTC